MTIGREAIDQQRIDEANIDEALSASAEKAAELLAERDRALEEAKHAIAERDERIAGFQSHDSELLAAVASGATARTARIARKQKALDALKKAGVVVGVVLAVLTAGAALEPYYPHLLEGFAPRIQVAVSDAPSAGFTRSLT